MDTPPDLRRCTIQGLRGKNLSRCEGFRRLLGRNPLLDTDLDVWVSLAVVDRFMVSPCVAGYRQCWRWS
jgi:hypothetical protein